MADKDSGVTIVEVDRSTTEVESASWYNQAHADAIDKWLSLIHI